MSQTPGEVRTRERVGGYVAFGLCVLGAALFWIHRVHVAAPSDHNFYGNGDLYRYHLPSAVFVHEELRAGRLPVWNPYQFAGQPFAALHVTSALYPPNLVSLALLPPARALELQAVLHLALAGFLTWLFAARIGLAPPARFLGAVGFALAPPMLHAIYQVPYLYTQVWLPGLLWGVTGLAQTRQLSWSLALAALLALAFLGGHAQGFLFEVQIMLAWATFALLAITQAARRLRVVGLLALSGVVALGLVAPQLLATLELLRDAVRSLAGVPFEEAAAGAVAPSGLATGLLGRPFANEAARWVTWPILGLPLAIAGLAVSQRRRFELFFLIAALVTALIAAGDATPVFRIYYALPLGDLFRVPNRISFAYVFLVAMGVAVGLQALDDLLSRKGLRRGRAVAVGLVALAAGADLYTRAEMRFAHPALRLDRSRAVDRLVEAVSRDANWRLFLEMGRSFERPEVDRKVGQMNRLFVVPDYEPTMLESYRDYFLPERPLWHGAVTTTPGGRTRDVVELRRLLDMMSVRYYASGRPVSAGALHRGLLLEFTGGVPRGPGPDLVLVERAAALPRAYTVRCGQWARDGDEALSRLLAPSFRPGREVVLTGSPRGSPLAGRDFPDPTCAAEAGPRSRPASIVAHHPHSLVVEASCTADCVLVLTDVFYPGWRARVDGEERSLVPANFLFRGLLLAPGRHRIEYHYEPAPLRLGFASACVTALVAIGLAVLGVRR